MIKTAPYGDNMLQMNRRRKSMSLLSCPECNHVVSDKAIACPGCGYPMAACTNPKTVLQKTCRRKLPNGYGSIKKLSGNRRRPYAVYPPLLVSSASSSSAVKSPALGYYKDWYSAFEALTQYHRNPYDVETRILTFAEVYKRFYKEKFEYGKKELSVSSKYAYDTAFKNCTSLHFLRFSDIRKQELQAVLDDCTLGYSSVCNLKKLFCQMYRFAIENDVVEKNYAQYVSINRNDDTEKGEPFSPEELDILWSNSRDKVVQMILIMIYSGFRIRAFETIEINTKEFYFKGGVKTAAGKGRIVPIHTAILPFALAFPVNFPKFRGNTFRSNYFYPTLKHLGIATTKSGKKHTPHDCRHTFSWLCDKYKVDELSKHLLMGHSPGKDIEKAVYGHRTFEELREEINKIEC